MKCALPFDRFRTGLLTPYITLYANCTGFRGNIKRNLYAHHQHIFGILVAILCEDNDRHHLPHIHARHSGMKTSIAIANGCALAGEVPAMQKIEVRLLGGAA